jgi:hypothetical protein
MEIGRSWLWEVAVGEVVGGADDVVLAFDAEENLEEGGLAASGAIGGVAVEEALELREAVGIEGELGGALR